MQSIEKAKSKKPNRVRKALSTTIDPDVRFVIYALADNKAIGAFVEEAVSQWFLNFAYFDIPKIGPVHLRDDHLYYIWVDMNDEECSPRFRTFEESLVWLKKTYPDINYNINFNRS